MAETNNSISKVGLGRVGSLVAATLLTIVLAATMRGKCKM